MGLLNNLKTRFSSQKREIVVKSPNIVVSNTPQSHIQESLTDNLNYLEQNTLWTYRALEFKATALASTEIYLCKNSGEDKIQLNETNNGLLRDLNNFNPHMSLNEARILREFHLGLTGTAFWVMFDSDIPGNRFDFYPLDPTRIEMNTDAFGLPKEYVYTDVDGNQEVLDPMQVIYFKAPDPKNWIKGYGVLQAIKDAHNSYEYAMKYNTASFYNRGRPDGLLLVNGGSASVIEQIQKKFKAKYSGIKNAGKFGVIGMPNDATAQFIETTKSQKDLDFVEGIKVLRSEILAMHGIPEALIFPSATQSNTKEATRIFQQYTLLPMVNRELGILNEQLLPKYYGDLKGEVYYFEIPDVVDEDVVEKTTIITTQYNSGIITLNQALEKLGYDPIEKEGDTRKEIGGGLFGNNNEQDKEEDQKKALKRIETKLANLYKKLENSNELPEEKKLELKRKQLLELTIARETIFKETTNKFFADQAKRTIENMQHKRVSFKLLPNLKKEIAYTEAFFKNTYERLAANFSSDANTEVKSILKEMSVHKFLEYREKLLNPEAMSLLQKRIDYFATEVNKTTLDKLEHVIADSIQEELSLVETQKKIAEVFDEYLSGAQNIEILKKYNVYVEAVGVTTDGEVVLQSGNRFNAMMEKITQSTLTPEQQREALIALKGTLDLSDPIAQSVDSLLTSIYKVTDSNPSITLSRAETIARTETGAVKGMIQRETYDNNEFVEGVKWITAHDSHVRLEHAAVDGDIVPKGEAFTVGGEKLMYPGDPSGSASNVINCRCDTVPVIKKD